MRLRKPKHEFTWKNLQTGETWTFPTHEALMAFLEMRKARTSLAGSAEPQEKITGLNAK